MKVTLDINSKVIVRWVLGILLIWAALSKLANLQDFYGNILGYTLPLPRLILSLVAMTLPWLELLCGLMLLARVRTETALVWTAMLCAIFVVATGQAWARGLQISCGCFNLELLGLGADDSLVKLFQSVGFAFFRALVLLAGALFLLRHELRSPPLSMESRL